MIENAERYTCAKTLKSLSSLYVVHGENTSISGTSATHRSYTIYVHSCRFALVGMRGQWIARNRGPSLILGDRVTTPFFDSCFHCCLRIQEVSMTFAGEKKDAVD